MTNLNTTEATPLLSCRIHSMNEWKNDLSVRQDDNGSVVIIAKQVYTAILSSFYRRIKLSKLSL